MEESIKNKIDELLEKESSEKELQTVSENAEKAVADYQQDSIKSIADKVKQGELDMNEAGKELAHTVMMAEAMQETEENEPFRKKFKKKKQEEMLQSADKTLAEEQAKTLTAKRLRAEEFYKSFRPILEMDLSPFLHNDNPQKRVKYTKEYDKSLKKMVKVPVEEAETTEDIKPVEEPKKVGYEDRSYGIPFMVFILIFLTIPYLIFLMHTFIHSFTLEFTQY